jgi:hypothetical protein
MLLRLFYNSLIFIEKNINLEFFRFSLTNLGGRSKKCNNIEARLYNPIRLCIFWLGQRVSWFASANNNY